ncbi:MAG: hypothetical protein Q8O99_05280, partial [bacterium]|nr:hypothetical protein [bacterium]
MTATQALYQKHLQMLDDLMKKGSLPQGVKIENIEKVQKMLENTRAKKLSALSAEELKTLLAG